MKKYSFQMTKKEVRELCFRGMWEQLILHRAKCLLLLAILALVGIFLSWAMSLVTAIILLLMFVFSIVRDISVMKKLLCDKTRAVWVEDGMLKQDSEGELYREIPCSSITKVSRSRHLLMLGLCQASKLVKWFPVPLRVFADGQERDGFVESVRNPQIQIREKSAVSGMGEHDGTLVTDVEAREAEKSEQEYFRLSSQVGEEEWVRMITAATENVQKGVLAKQRNCLVLIVLAAVLFAASVSSIQHSPSTADIMFAMSFVGMILYLLLLRNLLENPKNRIRTQIRKGIIQNNVQGVWNTSVTEMGIRQDISGEKSFMIPWKNLVCMVKTDMDLIFFQKDKWHYCVVPKEGLESPGQMESLKELCREKNMEVLAGKRKKYVPNWFFPLLTVVVIAGYVAIYVWM